MSQAMRAADIFGDHMVLQRDQPLLLFGTGDGTAEAVLGGHTARAESADGRWRLQLPAMPAGGPYTLQLRLNGKEQVWEDVYIGDVWMAAGQSNMELMLCDAQHTDDDLRTIPSVRYFKTTLENEGQRQWVEAGPDTTLHFSAIGGRFGRRMAEAHGIPVGIIGCSRGATCIESWTEKSRLCGTDLELPPEQRFHDAVLYPNNDYGDLYERMVTPLTPFRMCGVLWYQGESNRGPHDGALYGALLTQLIACWRERFEQPELPFLIVQLTRCGDDESVAFWPLIRQQQLEASRRIPHTAMVTTTDLGQTDQIHPVRKKEVADRLFLAAQHLVFGETAEYCGPLPEAADVDTDGIRITFSHAEGLHTEGELSDIFCLTEDGTLLHTPAVLDGGTLLIPLPQGSRVQEIRAWYRNDPIVTLYNGSGFPASPFSLRLA